MVFYDKSTCLDTLFERNAHEIPKIHRENKISNIFGQSCKQVLPSKHAVIKCTILLYQDLIQLQIQK